MIIPEKLKAGDTVRVIAPSHSFSIISKENREIAKRRFDEMGLRVEFGKHVEETDIFTSSSIESRLEDLHDAFADTKVKAVLPVIGGFNCNQLLSGIDWQLIENNPKIFGGYSDTTALQNAIYAKTGLVTYSSPAYSTFSQKKYFDYTLTYFKKCLFEDTPIDIEPSKQWSDDRWWEDQEDREVENNNGPVVIQEGECEGAIIGANLCTLNLLQGTEYMPSLENSVLFLEDDLEATPHHLDRDLQSLLHQKDAAGIQGIVLGRFQNESKITEDHLREIIARKQELKGIPVVVNADFGHTYPMFTFPIGGYAKILAYSNNIKIILEKH